MDTNNLLTAVSRIARFRHAGRVQQTTCSVPICTQSTNGCKVRRAQNPLPRLLVLLVQYWLQRVAYRDLRIGVLCESAFAATTTSRSTANSAGV